MRAERGGEDGREGGEEEVMDREKNGGKMDRETDRGREEGDE